MLFISEFISLQFINIAMTSNIIYLRVKCQRHVVYWWRHRYHVLASCNYGRVAIPSVPSVRLHPIPLHSSKEWHWVWQKSGKVCEKAEYGEVRDASPGRADIMCIFCVYISNAKTFAKMLSVSNNHSPAGTVPTCDVSVTWRCHYIHGRRSHDLDCDLRLYVVIVRSSRRPHRPRCLWHPATYVCSTIGARRWLVERRRSRRLSLTVCDHVITADSKSLNSDWVTGDGSIDV